MVSRRFAAPAALILVALLALPVQGDTQARGRGTAPTAAQARPQTPLDAARRAFNDGKYDQIDALTAGLKADDPAVAALRARALIARGKYSEAETLLRPIATRLPASEAALELGLLLDMLTRSEADAILERVANDRASDPASLARQARALRALGESQNANSLYRSASAAAPRDVAINTAWGELFLEKYNKPEAMNSFQAALEVDATYVPALLGIAKTLADDDTPQAMAVANRALEINPSSVDAHVFLASQAIDQTKYDDARASLEKALAINPSSLDAHAHMAALAFIQSKDTEYQAEVAKTLAIAPAYGEVYRLAGEMAARNYLFDDAVALIRKGVELDPENPAILADLGAQLLRTGDEAAARVALEKSFDIDPFSVVTYNLLAMMDTLDTFETVTDGDITLRLSPAESPVLKETAIGLAHQALKTVGAKYHFTPKGPILIEIFPKHDDFAVRVAGLPGMIGALGACFGRVVTLDSPKARPTGEFQWEGTLWHELTHVVTLQMSEQRIPRWLTEGVSEYEETQARPEWGRGMEVQFANLMARDEVIALKDLNAAFTDPKRITVAYYQATQLVEHIVSAYGAAGLERLIRSFSTGIDTDTALQSVLNTDFEGLQSGFDAFLEKKFGALKRAMSGPSDDELLQIPLSGLKALADKNPGSFKVQMLLGRELLEAGDDDGAIAAFEKAAALVPAASGPNNANAQIAAIALRKKDNARAIAALSEVIKSDFNNIDAARRLAGLLRDTGATNPDTLRPVYERIVAIDPFDAEAHGALGRLAMARSDAAAASREFRIVLALGPVDRAAAYTDLAESYFREGKHADAKKQTLAALEIAPTYARAQDLLLKLAAPDGR